MEPSKIIEEIKKIRKQQGYTQLEMASLLKCSVKHYNTFENKKAGFNIHFANKILSVLGKKIIITIENI